MYNNLNPVIMHLQIALYGSQAFVKAFGKKAVSISLSSLDEGNMETFKEAAGVTPILPIPERDDDDKAKEKKKQQRKLLEDSMAEEESLLNEDLFTMSQLRTPHLQRLRLAICSPKPPNPLSGRKARL